jgi:hypothetical protein
MPPLHSTHPMSRLNNASPGFSSAAATLLMTALRPVVALGSSTRSCVRARVCVCVLVLS